jgi:hypothetical protein
MVNERNRYVIDLPRDGVRVQGYESIPKTGESFASSEAQAVTQYLHRYLTGSAARIAAHRLAREFGSLDEFAIIVPEVDSADGTPLSYEERQQALENHFAQEIAAKKGSKDPSRYNRMARELLKTAARQRHIN